MKRPDGNGKYTVSDAEGMRWIKSKRAPKNPANGTCDEPGHELKGWDQPKETRGGAGTMPRGRRT
jgi:hypothetical protein